MKLRNTPKHYGVVTRFFHWLSALFIVGLFISGLWMLDLNYEDQYYDLAFHYHESIGLLLISFMLLRWLWRQANVLPEFDHSLSVIEKQLAISAHRLMYLLCFIIIITGYLIPTANGKGIDVFTWFAVPSLVELNSQQVDLAGEVHLWIAYTLMALASIHALAALKHQFIDRKN